MNAEAEVALILKILRIKPDEPIATVTELGLKTYRAHPDARVCSAMREYLAHPLSKPIATVRRPAYA
jgi:hypothetical protein